MKKIIAAVASVTAIATLVVPSLAAADVQRYQEQTGTMTVTLPEYGLVHTFNISALNPCDGSFTATGVRNVGGVTEDVTGALKGNQVSFAGVYTGSNYASEIGYTWHTIGSGTLGTTFKAADSTGLVFDVNVTANLTDSTHYKNHGDYVSSMGGGSDVAHSCIGMPIH